MPNAAFEIEVSECQDCPAYDTACGVCLALIKPVPSFVDRPDWCPLESGEVLVKLRLEP